MSDNRLFRYTILNPDTGEGRYDVVDLTSPETIEKAIGGISPALALAAVDELGWRSIQTRNINWPQVLTLLEIIIPQALRAVTEDTPCLTCNGTGWHHDRIARAGNPMTDPCDDCGGTGRAVTEDSK